MRALIYAFIRHVRKRFASLFVRIRSLICVRAMGWECFGLLLYVCCMYFGCSSTKGTWTRTMDKVFDMYFSIVITAISRWDKSNRALAWPVYIYTNEYTIHADCTRLETNDENMRCVSTHVRYVCLKLFWLWIHPSAVARLQMWSVKF